MLFLFHRSKFGTPTAVFASSPSQSTRAASPTSPSPPAASSSSARLWTGRSGRSTCTGELTENANVFEHVLCKYIVSWLRCRRLIMCLFVYNRYRNFRTFTSPRPAQFSSLAVDVSGELVSAGAQDSFEIFLWSMQTGRLLEVDTK